MARFISEINIPSCIVTKELIESIEKYLHAKFFAIATTDDDKSLLEEAISISITDSFGTERLKSITEFTQPRFSDNTTRISITIRRPYNSSFDHFEIDVQFDSSRMFTRAKADYEGINSREFVTGLLQGVLNCVGTTRTKNWLFNLPSGPEGGLWGIAIFSPAFVIPLFKSSSPLTWIPLLVVFSLYAYLFAAKRLRPYTTFDSNLADRRDKLWSWFVGGCLSFLIFSTALAKFRDFIFRYLQ